MSSRSSPHDALFKATFAHADLARSELELVLPAEVRMHLDLATLDVCPGSFVDDALRHAHADLLYRVSLRGADAGEALVYVLFEHQSTFDPQLPLRLLRYLVNVWEAWGRDHPGAKLPVVIPVVLGHDQDGWRAAPEFAPMLDATPELLAAVAPYQPLFRFVLDDLEALSVDALATRDLHALARLVELAFWSARSRGRLEEAAPHMAGILSRLVRDERSRRLLTQLYVYLLRDAPAGVEAHEVRAILERIAGPEGREDLMNAGEQLIAEGLQRGLERGRAEGRTEGRAEGRTEGRAEGLRTAIGTALSARGVSLSEQSRARLGSCDDVDVLTRWLTSAVTASSDAEVFETPANDE